MSVRLCTMCGYVAVIGCLLTLVLYPVDANNFDNADSEDGYRLSTQKEFLVMASMKVRPMQTYEMYVTLFSLHYSDMTIRAVLSQDNEEYATSQVIFYDKGTKRMQLLVPETVTMGVHKLVVEGHVSGGRGDPVFHNETILAFDPKYVSLFIQTDKPMYYPPQSVNFRILGVTPDLKPVHGEDMTIYVIDSFNNTVRRWLNQELQFGMYNNKFELSYPTHIGKWHMAVDAYGMRYTQPFEVDFYYRRVFEVNITTPLYIFNTDWGMMGTFYAEHWSGRAASGNATLVLRVRNPDGSFLEGEIRREIAYVNSINRMKGQMPFSFSIKEMESKWGELVDKELFVKGYFRDFYFMETQNGTSVTRVIKDAIVMKRLGKKFRTFKPDVPFTIYFAVSRSDGTRYKGTYNRQVLVEVSQEGDGPSRQYNERVIIPSDAIVRYEITPRLKDRKIKVMASHVRTGSAVEVWAYRYHSKTDRFISVTTSTPVPVTEEYMTFTVRTNFMIPEINYIITAAGNILLGNTLTMMSQQKTFSVALSRQMAPQSRMVVYCVKDEEILVDTLTFMVKDSRLHNASLLLNLGKDFNYHTIEVIGQGHPGAFIAISGLDYEWYRRGADTFLDEEKIITELMTYDNPSEGPYKHIWHHDSERWDESTFFTAHSGGVDFTTTMNVSGLVALSDMNFTVKQEYTSCNRSMNVGICLADSSCYDLDLECNGWADCKYDAFDEITCPMKEEEIPQKRPQDIKNLHKFYRYFEDASWAWQTEYVKPNGRVEIKLDAPEDTIPYVISGFIIHPEYGLSLFPQPIQHDTTRRFFMSSEYPTHTRRGEQIGIRLGIFNYWDQDIEALVTLHGGETYRFIHVEDFGYVSSYNPRVSAGDVQLMVELEAGNQKYIHFPVLPIIESGEIEVKITAYSPVDKDMEQIKIQVSYEGVANDDHIPFLMDLNNQGSQLSPYFDIPMPQQFTVPGRRELLYIPGSNTAYIHVYGDVVSPGFFEDHLDSENTVGMPDDSAEGYMYDFAINLQILLYLQETRALNDSVTQKALEYMQTILMRQYAYMQPDGSFVQFRRMSKPCVWVTSFVLRYLHKTLTTDWSKQVYIDLEVMNKIARWLVTTQNEEGAFVETADHYYDRNMGSMTRINGTDHEWHIPVTAHVVITFATTERLTGDAKSKSDNARVKATQYLSRKFPYITDPFQLAITAYALQLAKHKDRDAAFLQLQAMNRTDENMYWSATVIEPNPYEIIQNNHYMKPRQDYTNLAQAVMATSYALQLYLQHNLNAKALPIMKWLVAQHNGVMAWSSTQDTLLALEALAEFALDESNREFFNINVDLAATGNVNWGGKLHIDRNNFFVLQGHALENAFGAIKANLHGTGYGYVGVTPEWNVDKQEYVDNPDYRTFEVTLEEKRFSGHNASTMILKPCIRWLRSHDIAPVTGMVFVQVEVPTGYVVNRDEIEKLYWAGVPGLRRVRFRDGQLVLLIEYVRPDVPTCFTFEARRWYPVANISITHGINVVEYADSGVKWLHIYDTYTLFHLHICQVCGSFQCPYCPNYNTAPNFGASVCMVWFSVVFGQLLLTFVNRQRKGIGIITH